MRAGLRGAQAEGSMISAIVETLLGQVVMGIALLSCAMAASLMVAGAAVIAWQQTKRLLLWLAR